MDQFQTGRNSLSGLWQDRLVLGVGLTEVVSAKRHENGTLIQAGVSDYRKLLKRLAPQAGFEPATLRLTV